MANDVLLGLAEIIKAKGNSSSELSYTRQLLDAGLDRCAQKFGEEAVETLIAALHQSEDAFKKEAADLLYHLLVLLEARSVSISDVLQELEKRKKISGLAEKSARIKESY